MSIAAMHVALERLYPGNKGAEKAAILYELARKARGGCVVEVGASTGYGSIALAFGARDGQRMRVYAVDDYAERRGWANEDYPPENRVTFEANVNAAGVTVGLIQKTAAEAVEGWQEPVALLFWDPGVKVDSVLNELMDWADTIEVGGVLALNETFEGNLGVDGAVAELVAMGAFELEAVRYAIRILRRV